VPLSIRHRGAAYAVSAAAVLVIAGAIVALVLHAHHNGSHRGRHGGGGALTPAAVCPTCAHSYNPDGLNGDITQDDAQAVNVVNGNGATGWSTESYYTGSLDKPGVGVYVWTSAAVAVRQVTVKTSTPGWSGQILGTNTQPNLYKFTGWKPLASSASVAGTETFHLGGRTRYRYYLVWITKLPPSSQFVKLNEVRLYS
jgi:hypothetical protein